MEGESEGIGSDMEAPSLSDPTAVIQVSLQNAVQVQGVIQSPSVIQTATGQAIQVATLTGEGDADNDLDEKKKRDMLARRPSYRRIFNDLSGEPVSVAIGNQITKIEEDAESSHESQDSDGHEAANINLNNAVQYQQVLPAQAIQIGDTGLQTLTMSNVNNSSPTGATIVQYAQGPDGQFFIPVSTLGGNTVQAYQISSPGAAISQGVMMSGAATSNGPEEASRKRELRLLKNRDAARECRRKKKEYVKCLENRVAVLENQNKTLIEELKSLKELYCQKE